MKYSVLIVEDTKALAVLVEKFLSFHPELKVSGIASNGKEALNILRSNKIDLILLDINLPDISGFELLDRISDKPHVIITTGDSKLAVKAFEYGAIDYLLKPFSIKRFNFAIHKFLVVAGAKIATQDSIHGHEFLSPEFDY